jgi:hypothetical protein
VAKQTAKTEQPDETGKGMQTKEKIKAEICDFQTGAAQNGNERSSLENALLDLTRTALGSSLDDFADELPPEKKNWLDNVKKALNKEISQPEDKTNSADVKLNLIRIEIARETSRIDKAKEPENAKQAQKASENFETKKTVIPKKNKKYTPINLNQVLLRRTLV